MKNKILFVFVIFTVFITLFAQDSDKELMELGNKKRELKKQVYDKTLKFVTDNPEAGGNAKLYFNLAELSTELYAYELDITINYYKKVLDLEPDYADKDVVLYNIGYFSFLKEKYERDNERLKNLEKVINWPDELRLSEEKLSTTINAYTELMNNYPKSVYYVESIYRLGTVYFEIALDSSNPLEIYPKAIYYFDIVANTPDHKLHDYGLFQRGWTYFSNGDFDLAIADFSSLLDKIVVDSQDVKKAYFEADAIENIAFSLIEKDGTDFEQQSKAADQAKLLLKNFVNEEYSKKVIHEAINLKLKYSAPMQAIDLYNVYLELYPLSTNCPSIVDSIMNVYKRYPNRTRDNKDAKDMIILEMERIVKTYTPDSEWYIENKNKDISNELLVIRDAFEFIEPRYSNNFSKNQTEENYITYNKLVDNYNNFEEFQDQTGLVNIKAMRRKSVNMGFNLSLSRKDPSLYYTVTRSIDDYIQDYPDHEDLNTLQEEKFYANEQIYLLLKDSILDSVYVDTLRNLTLNKDSLDTLYIDATKEFEELLLTEGYENDKKDSELIRIIYQRADIYYNRAEYDFATDRSRSIEEG